jgi:hypothetical protein
MLASIAAADINVTITNTSVTPKSIGYATGSPIHVDYSVLVPTALASNDTLDTFMQICAPSVVGAGCISTKAHHFPEAAGTITMHDKAATDFAWWMNPPGDLPPGE